MGQAIAQINDAYIVSRTKNGLVIVDQHAAHERILLETMQSEVTVQPLLVPEVIEISIPETDRLREMVPLLKNVGVEISIDSPNQIVVRAIPQIAKTMDFKALFTDIANDIEFYEQIISADVKAIRSVIACHSSIKAGKILTVVEMNALLRLMESIPFFSQCNHGRPTYIRLPYDHIDKAFRR